ncbi:type II toxin-antitoxin system VapC family toxin [Tunicatimonas pelagia]|uniref:type II toxin-antitoxin system VapC family toxin n=1 Tax=Tunicatimonas pelagia TaxID=931531 RepID=UPI0026662065|nr:PIN domain-containing protein [Tunicatimonas pelagia]WKN40745.1 PIN domain-containing protein [Tunicatimonas pelagia]
MKVYFLDINIILDFLGNRKPFGKFALQIFNQGRTKQWQLWTSDNSIITAYYILEKEVGRDDAKEKIGRLLQYINIQPIYKEDLLAAITSKFKDFEDGAQYFCALRQGEVDAIITRNKKDFKASQIPILGSEEVIL